MFGGGLIISDMVNPARVLAFLDVTGEWDPSLAFVMGGAVIVTSIGYRVLFGRGKPLFADDFSVPVNRQLDAGLFVGPVLFGVGWGLVGLCPGPAIVSLITAPVPTAVFVCAMIAGMFLARRRPWTGVQTAVAGR